MTWRPYPGMALAGEGAVGYNNPGDYTE